MTDTTKRKNEKRVITFQGQVLELLDEMMKEDYQSSLSTFVNLLVTQEKKRRDEAKNKRPVGRPKKDGDDDGHDDPDWEGAVYKHPDEMMNADRLCTRTEMEGWYNLKGLPVPANPKRIDGK